MSWVLVRVPKAFADAIIAIGGFISPVLNAYRDASRAIFQFLPFDVPDVVSSTLPIVFIVGSQYLVSFLSSRWADKILHERAIQYGNLIQVNRPHKVDRDVADRELQRLDTLQERVNLDIGRYYKLKARYRTPSHLCHH